MENPSSVGILHVDTSPTTPAAGFQNGDSAGRVGAYGEPHELPHSGASTAEFSSEACRLLQNGLSALEDGNCRSAIARPVAEECFDRFSGSARLLADTWPFNELPGSVLTAMLERMEECQYITGDVLITQGQRCPHLLVLVEGILQVSLEDGGECHQIAQTGGVAIVGEMGLLTGEPCTATVTAATPARALVLSAEQFHAMTARYPVLGSALNELVAGRLGHMPVDTLTGKILRGYRIKRCAGRGGMAVVYESQSLANDERVALKMLSHRFVHNLEIQHRFEREIRICRSFRHPNICQILDHFTAFGTYFMVLEFCDGVTLDQYIRRDPLTEEQIRKIVAQLARALSYAHERGVCHRDVKPSNVMIGEDGTLKLMDFGLARSSDDPDLGLTSPGCVLGTPYYMSPEQLGGKRADHRTDLFALGCVVYQMLQGKPLFTEKTLMGIMRQHLQWHLPPPDEIRIGLSTDLYELLRQSLVADPEERRLDLATLVGWGQSD